MKGENGGNARGMNRGHNQRMEFSDRWLNHFLIDPI